MTQPNSSRWRARIRFLFCLGVALLLLALAVGVHSYFAFRDRQPGYSLDLNLDGQSSRAHPRPLQVGFARVKINPDLSELASGVVTLSLIGGGSPLLTIKPGSYRWPESLITR